MAIGTRRHQGFSIPIKDLPLAHQPESRVPRREEEATTIEDQWDAKDGSEAKDAPGAQERREVQSQTGPQGISGSSLVASRVHRLTGSGDSLPPRDDI